METLVTDSSGDTEPFLAFDVMLELSNPSFDNRKHGSRHTYKAGCHGPLCKWAHTLRGRLISQQKCQREGRPYRPSFIRPRDDSRAEELDAVIAWHQQAHATRRERERAEREAAALQRKLKTDTWEAELAS